ncbi:hypothetical protein Tco_0106901, partial [Tanacetum coccineum]
MQCSKNGPWFIWNNPFILKKWNLDVNLLKEDVSDVPLWVKFHGVPMTAFSEDGLSAISTKLCTPLMIESYTSDMYIQSRGRSSYARALIELRADVKLKDTIVVATPKLIGKGFYMCTIRVEYEWKPPRCSSCKVFGHVLDERPTKIISEVVKNLKNPRQTTRGVQVGPKVSFKPIKRVYRPISNKNVAITSGKKKQAEMSGQEVKNDDGLGSNREILEAAGNDPWFIRNNLLILKKWHLDENLLKEDVNNIPVWVKLHGVPVTAFSDDGLSAIATKLGTPLMLHSYTADMCMQSWGR